MPTVPVYSSAQVGPAPIPAPYEQGVSPRILMTEGMAGAREESAAGQALQNTGDEMSNEAAQAQGLANQVRVDAAMNNVRQQRLNLTYDPQQGYQNVTGAAALNPNAQGQSLPQQYGAQLQDAINKESAALGNDAQRRVFNEQAAQEQTQFTGDVQQHMLQQYRQFGLDTQQGTIDLATNTAKLNWQDPDKVNAQVLNAQAAVYKAGLIKGQPADLIQSEIQNTTSAIHSGVISAALENNEPDYAMAYMNTHKGDMTADDLLKANSQVTSDIRARVATGTAQNAMQAVQAKGQPAAIDQMAQITSAAESSNNPNAVGPNVPGQGTAKGAMQVMDATTANPGYGVKPAADNSPAERARVGRDYLAAMVQRYGGDPAKAWAAYNDGPGNVDKALASSKASGGNWLAAMPQATQDYVSKNVAALQKEQISTPAIPSLQDVHDNIRQQLGPNTDPRTLAAALAEGDRQYKDYLDNRKVQGENTVQQAQQYLIQNKGDFQSMPPDMRAAVIRDAPDKWNDLQTFAKSVASPPATSNMPAYLDAVAHPDELAKMPDAVFNHFALTNFAPDDAKSIAKLREDVISGKTDQSAGGLNRPALNAALNNRLTTIGIDPESKNLSDRERIGSIQKFITDGVFAQQQQLGRKMTPQEVSDYVDTTMSKNLAFRNSFLGFNTGPSTQNMMSMQVSDIPSDSLANIKTALAKAGVSNPNNDQIIRTYWTSRQKDAR